MRVEFPSGLDGTAELPRTQRDLLNCYNNGKGNIIGRQGISLISRPGDVAVARGGFEWNGSLYEVYSTNLKKSIDVDTGTFSNIGTIADSSPIKVAIGFNTATIVVPGGNIYTLDKFDTLVTISGNANFVPTNDIAHMNGRFIYIPTDGSPAFFSDVGAAGTVQPLSFFDAEELPDDNNAVFNGKNTLFITGTDSIELFRDTGASPVPYIRITGSRILNGFIGGLLEYNNTFLLVGREKGQNFGIYSIVQGGAAKLSNEAVDEILSTYTIDELKETLTGRLKHNGNDIATFRLPRDSFAFFGGNWFSLDTIRDDVSRPWSAGFITQFDGAYFSAFDDSFGKFADVNTDYGERVTRIIRTAVAQEDGEDFSFQQLELGISQGFNASTGTVSLRTSDDNVDFGDSVFESTGAIGQYGNKLHWNYPGGLGTYPGFMGIELRTTDDINFSADHFILK